MKNIYKFFIIFFLLNSFIIKSQILKNLSSSFQSNSAYYMTKKQEILLKKIDLDQIII